MAIGPAAITIELNITRMTASEWQERRTQISGLLKQNLKDEEVLEIEREFRALKGRSQLQVGRLYMLLDISIDEENWLNNEFRALLGKICGQGNILQVECSRFM